MSSSPAFKFNEMFKLFLEDMSDTVPESQSLRRAAQWVGALHAVDPENTAVAEYMVNGAKSCREALLARDAAFLVQKGSVVPPELIDVDEFAYVFKMLSPEDKVMIWKYIVRLYKLGRKVLEMELAETDDDKRKWEEALEVAMKPASTLLETLNSDGKSLSEIELPDGSLAFHGYGMMVNLYKDHVSRIAPQIALSDSVDGERAFGYIKAQFGGKDGLAKLCSQRIKSIESCGVPLSKIRGKDGGALFSSLDERAREEIAMYSMALATMSFMLVQVDEKALGSAEKMVRDFVGKVKAGEIQSMGQIKTLDDLIQFSSHVDVGELLGSLRNMNAKNPIKP